MSGTRCEHFFGIQFRSYFLFSVSIKIFWMAASTCNLKDNRHVLAAMTYKIIFPKVSNWVRENPN